MLPRDTEIELPLLNETFWCGGAFELYGEIEKREALFYKNLPKYFSNLTDEDLSVQKPSGGSWWENRVHNARRNLVKKGQFEHLVDIGRGNWQLTDLGRQRLCLEHHELHDRGIDELCSVCHGIW